MKRLLLTLLLGFTSTIATKAQTYNVGGPVSFTSSKLSDDSKVSEHIMPVFNLEKQLEEDLINQNNKVGPFRFGYEHLTNFDLQNSGTWYTTNEGDRVWKIKFSSPGALSMNVIFNDFYIPNGAFVHLYNKETNMVVGAYTANNNNVNNMLGSDLIKGGTVVVEYFEPSEVEGQGRLLIGMVVHGYKDINDWYHLKVNESGACNMDVICPDGQPWANEIRSVVRIANGGGLCSGTLVNNTSQDGTPYIITANHCGPSSMGSAVFKFNYDSPICGSQTSANSQGSSGNSINGSSFKASNSDSDFGLVELNSIPPASYAVYYAGWDNSGNIPQTGVSIHHPSGDVKKISFDDDPITSAAGLSIANSSWRIEAWERNTTTEGGSSGCGLWDENHHLIGQLHGGQASCSNSVNDYYGKFSMSWTGNGSSSSVSRLSDWLDPQNLGLVALNGCDLLNGCDPLDSCITLNALNDTVCGSYTLNGQTYTSSGFYTQILTNVAGCDSTITLNLTVNPNQFSPDFSVNQTLFTAPPFAAQFTNTTPNASNYNFTWDFSDGTILQSNNPSVFHEYLYNGLYDVTLIAEDINTGCTDTIFYDDYIYCTGGTSCTHASTINQTGPISACLSDSVFLSCNTGSNYTYQWRLNGTYIPGAVDTIYYPTQTGNYSVLIMDNGCPEVSPDVSVVISSSLQTPIITPSGNITPCLGGSVTLSVPNTYSSYNWSSGGTSSSEVVTSSGSYFVTVSNSAGCEVSSPVYTINASFATPPDVCIVGVDSITNYNKVVWEKPISTSIDSFYVYKESNQANIYQKIGGTSYSDTAVFNDLSSNPAAQAYRYKLSLVDSCGIESSLGSMHKSIHLTINQGVGTTWNLIWSHYEGFTFPSYNIYRGTSSTYMTLLTTIASNLNSYTDLTAPTGQLFYQIEVVSNYTCDPLKSNYNVSRSNVVDNAEAPSIIVQQENSNVNAYPNPTQDQITIDIKGYNGDVNVEVYDLQGRLLETTTNTIVSLKKHAKGIYVLKVSYGEVTEEIRVVRD